ncbi:MAG: YeeE/YedE family protein [Deltaproteobacteria bacterium]|nr:YeeE/YedE family protein [Deltaproteobacteria bacterium]MBN2671645.1 YeeE/YedE family protein [Deltaproteobacteria bacterium]
MAPFDFSAFAGTLPYYTIFLVIGIAFGAVLELSGFGDSRKLAAQFYLTDLTVLKVMFTAIVVACVLIFSASALGLLEFSRVWVNPTYLVPGIIGGLIMGVGFILGGFCPGTSVVAASTFKLDGLAFVGGVGLGTLLFSETASLLGDARHDTFMGRFMLNELFGVPVGIAVVLLISMALMMFWAAELAEKYFGRNEKITKDALLPKNKKKIAAAGVLFSGAVLVAVLGQPGSMEKWEAVAKKSKISLENRDPFIHPAEVVEWRAENSVYVRILDVRSEDDFNKFHLLGAIRVTEQSLTDAEYVKVLKNVPDNTLTFVVSNTEEYATAAWKRLVGSGVKNVYIIEGGINNWLKLYPTDPCVSTPITDRKLKKEELAFRFAKSVGGSCYAAHPEAQFKEPPTDCYMEAHPELKNKSKSVTRDVPFDANKKHKFTRKVKMRKSNGPVGGCG